MIRTLGRGLGWVLSLAAFELAFGCSSFIEPPVVDDEPTETVWVGFESLHRGLWMPAANEGFVEYGFGDWAWYAERKEGALDTIPTLLWPTEGTIARRVGPGPDIEAVKEEYPSIRFEALEVPRSKMLALRERLDRTWAERGAIEGAETVFNERRSMNYRRIPERYTMVHSCVDAVCVWLEELGATVTFTPIRTGLRVRD